MKFSRLVILLAVTACLVKCGISTNSELVSLMDATVKNCDFGDKDGSTNNYGWKIEACKNDELKKAQKFVVEKSLKDTLPTLTVALGDKDQKKASLSVYLINKVAWDKGFKELAQNPQLISDKVAKKLIENFKAQSDKSWIQYGVKGITHVGVIKGLSSDLFAIADSAKPGSHVKHGIYANSLLYGRLNLLPKLQALAKSQNSQDQFTAIGSVDSLREGITDAEKDAVCKWLATDNLSHTDEFVTAEVTARIASYCKGEFLDKSLDLIDKKIKDAKGKKIHGSYKYGLIWITCPPSGRGTQDQCKRKDALLKKYEALK